MSAVPVAKTKTISDKEFYAREFTQKPIAIECPENGVHPWLPSISRRLWQRGYSDREIFTLLRKATRNVRHRSVSDSEILDAIALVIGTDINSLGIRHAGAHEVKPIYDPEYLREIASRIPDTVNAAYLEARSQFSCWNRTPAGFLHKLFRPGEHVWVTSNAKSSDGEIWTHDGDGQRFDELNHLATGCVGVWYLTNPLDGELHTIERCKKKTNPNGHSFTTLECISDWRNMLVETDVAPRELWRKVVVQLPLKILAVYDSGGAGDHTIIRIDAKSKDDWERIVGQYDHDLIRLGACPGSLTARRLSRLPNCMRGQTGNPQQLLYLNPDADGTPICQLPAREWTHGVYPNESPDL